MPRVESVTRAAITSGIVCSERKNRAVLMEQIRDIFVCHHGRMGSSKMRVELAKRGFVAGKNRIAQSMRAQGLRAKTHKRFRVTTTDSNHTHPIAENLLNRKFTVDASNQVLVSDITYVKTLTGWVYLTVFIDLYSRFVVGWSVSSTLSTDMVLTA